MFDDDWGANKNFANKAKTIMMEYGFEEVNNASQAEGSIMIKRKGTFA